MDATFPSDEYCTALGRATIAWAILESGIDFLVATTFRGFGGHPKHPEIPRALERKLTYLRAVARHDNMQPWRDEMNHLVAEALRLKETRHAAVHGVVGENLSDDVLKLWKITYGKTQHGTSDHILSTETLSVLFSDILTLTKRLTKVVNEQIDTITKTADQPTG